MQITDIIKTSSDRLFIVDTECFIIFTGESLNDEKPFIRIGTWYGLPVEIIPLVENIIVSDKIIGNPSYEQFNIDIRNLEANRYIGGESILKRFLDYQKIFGLDLTNASLVKIEKDIPALPNRKNISDRNQFIGIFYSDGNIKINHGKENIFDLNSINDENLSYTDILNQISTNSKNSDRYKGSGFIILNHNPIFYQKGAFTSYQFPDNCFNDFSTLQIDPNYIRELLLPSDNLINTSNFMKFKNNRNGKVKLYSDNAERIELIKRIFKNVTVNYEKFTNLNIKTPEGLRVNSYYDSPNIKVSFNQPPNPDTEISVSFIKSSTDVDKILKDKSDVILSTFTAFEESNLLFKSTVKPLLLIDDNSPNIKKVNEADKIILRSGFQYELKKFNTLDDLLEEFKGLDEIKDALKNFDKENVTNLINDQLENNKSLSVYNILNLLKTIIDNTTDRKKYSALKDIYQTFNKTIPFNPDDELKSSTKIIIALYDNTCSAIITPIQNNYKERFTDVFNEDVLNEKTINPEQKTSIQRIIKDRERLNKLLKIFYKEIENYPSFDTMKREISLLKNEISTLREIYSDDFFLNENDDKFESDENKKNTVGNILKKLNLFNKQNKDNASERNESSFDSSKDLYGEYNAGKNSESGKRGKPGSKLAATSARDDDSFDSKLRESAELASAYNYDEDKKTTAGSFLRNSKLKLLSLFRGQNKDDAAAGSYNDYAERNRTGILQTIDKKKIIIAAILTLILLLAIYLFVKNNYSNKDPYTQNTTDTQKNITDSNLKNIEDKDKIFTVKRVNEAEKEILQKHRVNISESDIYHYSNRVAVKNGYSEISYDYALRDKNPHWIYPSNVFVMLDEEKVTVQKGDTLWDLSRAKLEKMNADFYMIIDEIDKTKNKSKINALIIEAEKHSFMKQQIQILESYKKRFNNE